MIRIYKIAIAIFICACLGGCFSARKYNGASVNDGNEYIIRYAFRAPDSAPHDGVDIFWKNVDSLLPDTYIKRFFRLKKNGEIVPKDPRARNRMIYLYRVDFPCFIRSEMGNIVNFTAESNNILDRRLIYFDHNGNIREIGLHNGDILYCDEGTGDYIDIYDDYDSTVDTVRYFSTDHGYRNYWKYDHSGLWNHQLVQILNDTLLLLEKRRGHIKYRGSIQNNYKVGEWRYYNKNGELERTEHYTLRDREDVRFPYNYLRKRKTRAVKREQIPFHIVVPSDSIKI